MRTCFDCGADVPAGLCPRCGGSAETLAPPLQTTGIALADTDAASAGDRVRLVRDGRVVVAGRIVGLDPELGLVVVDDDGNEWTTAEPGRWWRGAGWMAGG